MSYFTHVFWADFPIKMLTQKELRCLSYSVKNTTNIMLILT